MRSEVNDEKNSPKGKAERGSALVMAVFVLALLTAMGGALLFLSQTEIKMSEASVNPKKAFYYAEAGLEHARQALWLNAGAGPFAPFLVLATGGDPLDPIGFDPDNIAAVYDSNGNVTGFSGYDNDTPLVGIQNLDDGWYAAFMTNDLGEGRTNQRDSDDRVILAGAHVTGFAVDGGDVLVDALVTSHQLGEADVAELAVGGRHADTRGAGEHSAHGCRGVGLAERDLGHVANLAPDPQRDVHGVDDLDRVLPGDTQPLATRDQEHHIRRQSAPFGHQAGGL